MKLVREHINEKFSEEGDPIHDMGIGPQGIVYRCGECGDLLDDNYNFLVNEKEFEYAKAIINAFGENSDRVKYVWCNRCREEDLARQEAEDYAREQERERERFEEDQRWHEENDEYYR